MPTLRPHPSSVASEFAFNTTPWPFSCTLKSEKHWSKALRDMEWFCVLQQTPSPGSCSAKSPGLLLCVWGSASLSLPLGSQEPLPSVSFSPPRRWGLHGADSAVPIWPWGCRVRPPGTAELRGGKRKEWNCTPCPLGCRLCGREEQRGRGGGISAAGSLRSLSYCPPAAQSSPTPPFLFGDSCQKTHDSAPNMWLAGGQGLAADRLTNLLASDGVPLLAAAGTASGDGHSWGSSGRGLQRLLGSILRVTTFLPALSLPLLYSSLIPSAVISPHSPSTHCPHLHRNTLQYCPKLPSFNPTYPSSHCSSFLSPNSKTSWKNGLHVLFISPLFHSFLYSLQLAFYSHSSIQTALTKPPTTTPMLTMV